MKRLRLLYEGFRIAWRSLGAHRLRTALTMLGVAIGIFAITIIFTLVNSLTAALNKNLSELGNTVLFVHHVPWTNDAMKNWQKYYQRPKVSFAEFQRLKRDLEHVDGVAYEVRIRNQLLKYQGIAIQGVGLRAITEDFTWINAFDLEEGRPFTAIEINAGRPVCLIGHNVAEALFQGGNPVGKYIQLRGKKVRVVGTIAKSGANMFGSKPDDMIFLPYGYATRVYKMDETSSLDKYIQIRVSDAKWMGNVEDQIIGLLRQERGLRPREESNFEVNRPEMLINMFSSATDYLQIGGIVISIFSILVGGFGIGNIMYATVKERGFEIGLSKALGATSGFILFQFLAESVLLCLMGGILGLLLNFALISVLQYIIDSMEVNFELVISVGSLITGVILSVVIGLVSGFIPSALAARMDPIESMRA